MESHNKKSFKVKLNPHITIYPVEERVFKSSELKEWAEKHKYAWGLYNGNIALPYESFIKMIDN